MTRFRLDARRFHGPLDAPVRNDTEQRESDDLAALDEVARALVDQGYTVWLYERIRRVDPPPEAHHLRLLRQLTPEAGSGGDPDAG